MNEPINIGFIGGGPRSTGLFSTLIMNREFEDAFIPVAMLDANEQTVKDWRYKVDNGYSSMDAFLKNEELDAALIITPPITHAPFAIKCLEAGMNVWSEVPMALELDDLFKIRDAERANRGNKGKYALGENYCWYIGNQFAKSLVEKGKMGDLFYMEGVYHHSVEHYMIEENFIGGKSIDPELDKSTKPTWRATLPPITYGHAGGPCLYVLNTQSRDKPVEVSAFGNMKMQKRFNNDNFQIGMFRTKNDVICKFGSGFVLPNHGFTKHIYWGTKCLLEAPHSFNNDFYLYSVPDGQEHFPARHEQEGTILSENDIKERGVNFAEGGHGGADTLMFKEWLASIRNEKEYSIDAVKGAEMTALGICGYQAIQEHKIIKIPDFE
ncbi:MAG: Gfo/Idh/MocA family protein [Promethearchaeota archaeon]